MFITKNNTLTFKKLAMTYSERGNKVFQIANSFLHVREHQTFLKTIKEFLKN